MLRVVAAEEGQERVWFRHFFGVGLGVGEVGMLESLEVRSDSRG
jgi:hypothetical protein